MLARPRLRAGRLAPPVVGVQVHQGLGRQRRDVRVRGWRRAQRCHTRVRSACSSMPMPAGCRAESASISARHTTRRRHATARELQGASTRGGRRTSAMSALIVGPSAQARPQAAAAHACRAAARAPNERAASPGLNPQTITRPCANSRRAVAEADTSSARYAPMPSNKGAGGADAATARSGASVGSSPIRMRRRSAFIAACVGDSA